MKNSNCFGGAISHSPLHLCETIEEAKVYLSQGYLADELFEIIGSPLHSVDSEILLEHFLRLGANPNAGESVGRATPLHTQDDIGMLKLLVMYGANPNAKNSWGQTPLAVSETIDKVNFLLSIGADPNVRDDDGLLPDEWDGRLMKEAVRMARCR